jgi:hypothetical protein
MTTLPERLRASAQEMRGLFLVSENVPNVRMIYKEDRDRIARELEEAAGALERAEKDAARYRWLVDPANASRDEWNLFGPYSSPQEIDSAIDSAMGVVNQQGTDGGVPADDSPRWARLDELREMARQFVCHPVSRGISDCEEAGELMTEAAAEIERLCRVRNCLAGSSRTRTARLRQLEQQRDYLLAEMRRTDNDTGNAGHYASEAVAAICAEEGAASAVRDFTEESAQSLRDLRAAALLALGLLWMTERQSDKVHRAYTTLRDALGGKEALREGIQAAMNAGHEADHPHGADWWAGKKDAAGVAGKEGGQHG